MIPRILHAWWGGPPMPAHLAAHLEAWRDLHPDWELKLWTPETTPNLRHQDLYDHPGTYSPASNPWQWRSDLARYEILHAHGGVYIDCDLEPLRPIDPLVDGVEAVIAMESDTFINNAFLASVPGSRFLGAVLDGLRASVLAQPRSRVNRQIGAYYLTKLIRRHPEVRVLPRATVYPYGWWELDRADDDFPDSYAVHRWHNKTTQETL